MKTAKFIEERDPLMEVLKYELSNNSTETKVIVLNGTPFERSADLDKVLLSLDKGEIAWLLIAAESDDIFHTIGMIKIMQTNRHVPVPSR